MEQLLSRPNDTPKSVAVFHADSETSRCLRLAAYCRVSTENEEQTSSLINQRIHFERLVEDRENQVLVGVYYDDGISGVGRKDRPGMKALLECCRQGQVDLILVKSISRFSRDVEECLELVRELKEMGVGVFFEKENIDTRKPEGDFLLSLLAMMAAEESRSISENEKWSIQKRFADGTFKLSRAPYGYEFRDDQIKVIEEEASVVEYMVCCILEGQGTGMVADRLNRLGVPTKRGGRWHAGTILNLLSNVFLQGDLLMQKTWRDSDYHVRRNKGEYQQYLIRDHHEAIIDRDTGKKVIEALRRRGAENRRNSGGKKEYPLSRKIFCQECGRAFKRILVKRKHDRGVFWGCTGHQKNKELCSQTRIPEENIMNAYITMLNKLAFARDMILEPYRDYLSKEDPPQGCHISQYDSIEEYGKLVGLFSTGKISAEEFYRRRFRLYRQRNSGENISKKMNPLLAATSKLIEYISLPDRIPSRDRDCFSSIIERVSVGTVKGSGTGQDSRDKTQLTFFLQCGLHFTETI